LEVNVPQIGACEVAIWKNRGSLPAHPCSGKTHPLPAAARRKIEVETDRLSDHDATADHLLAGQ
jgi:hypothetical protein